MSLFAPLLISFFFSGFAVAVISAPDCSTALSSTWTWSFNTLGQNPCTVAAYMLSTCSGGSTTLVPLLTGELYVPYQDTNFCWCSAIAYSLLSACDGCQGSIWNSWLEYTYNCTNTLPPSSFPNPVPEGTRLPQWALIGVKSGSTWNQSMAIAVGDSPELGPGTTLPGSSSSSSSTGQSSSSLTGPSTTYSSAHPSNTTTIVGGHSSNTGAIAGGVVAGVAAIFIAAVALFFYRKRRRSLAPPTFDEQTGEYNPQVMSGHETVTSSLPETSASLFSSLPETSTSLLRPYNPDDPTTFPGYQAPNPPFVPAQARFSFDANHLYTGDARPIPEVQG